MIIKVQLIDEKITPVFRQRIRRWVQNLETYHDRILEANVILKKDNKSKDKGSHCEIRLVIRGNDLFGKSSAENFAVATENVVESLRKQLRKKKTTKLAQRRKGSIEL